MTDLDKLNALLDLYGEAVRAAWNETNPTQSGLTRLVADDMHDLVWGCVAAGRIVDLGWEAKEWRLTARRSGSQAAAAIYAAWADRLANLSVPDGKVGT